MSASFHGDDDDRFLTEKQAAARLGLNPKTLCVWRAERKGPSYLKCGRAVRYSVRSLIAWEEKNTVVIDPRRGDRA
jgi:predicted DNA-binding transcriptional regulator AlpA